MFFSRFVSLEVDRSETLGCDEWTRPARWIFRNDSHAGPIRRVTTDRNADDSGVRTDDRISRQRPRFAGVFVVARQTKSGTFGPGLHQPFSLSDVPFRPDLPFGQQCSFQHPGKQERRDGQASDDADQSHASFRLCVLCCRLLIVSNSWFTWFPCLAQESVISSHAGLDVHDRTTNIAFALLPPGLVAGRRQIGLRKGEAP